jgi:dCMP deaminase
LILQSGIKRVVYMDEYRDPAGLDLLKKAGIDIVRMPAEKY